ncbi:MAG: LamG domain-containing protein, partial [Lentisphaerae bacterium]|nr:LamG domain-containing protein [Lentisphaerota bacterium]
MNIRMVTLGMALALAGGGWVNVDRAMAAGSEPDARGLVAHWTFDEGSGEVARDVTGNGHDATLKNVDWVPSPRGHALRFDSKEDLAQYGNVESMMLSGDATLAVWVKTDVGVAPNTHRLIFGDVGYAVMRNANLAVDSYNRLSFEWGDGTSAATILAPGALMNGAWKHVVASADSTAMRAALYVDGAVVAELPMPLPISKTAARERITGWFYNGFFQGDLDDIRLYSRALGPAEVQGLFRSQAEVTVSAC